MTKKDFQHVKIDEICWNKIEIANVELNSLETSCKNAKEEYEKIQSKFLRLKQYGAAADERNGCENNNNNPLVMYSEKIQDLRNMVDKNVKLLK